MATAAINVGGGLSMAINSSYSLGSRKLIFPTRDFLFSPVGTLRCLPRKNGARQLTLSRTPFTPYRQGKQRTYSCKRILSIAGDQDDVDFENFENDKFGREAATTDEMENIPLAESASVGFPRKSDSIPVHSALQQLSNLQHQIVDYIRGALACMQKPALVALLVLAMIVSSPDLANAAKGGGRVGGSSFSSRGSSSSSGYSRSSTGSYGPTFSAPYYAPSPFFGGPRFFSPSPPVVVSDGGFGFMFNLLFFGFVGFVIFTTISSMVGGSGESLMTAGSTTSVIRLQVGLLGIARSLQRDLERIADRADTSTPEGLRYVLTETVLSLLRHPDYCVYGFSSSNVEKSVEAGERRFNAISFEERSKFEEETLVNVGSVRKQVNRASSSQRFTSEYIVVTLVVATEGKVNIPQIRSRADLKKSLSELGSLTSDQIQAVEILWTPQNEADTLSEVEVLQDYPDLRSL